MKNIYFLSDAHLGCRALKHRRMQERRLVNFLDNIKRSAAAVYMLGCGCTTIWSASAES